MKILLIEDDAKVASFICKGLEEQHYEVDAARDGNDGEALLQNYTYDLILLDLLLPGRDGVEVCKSIRKRHKDIPILMLTALSTTEDKVKGLNSGADDYLIKPFDFKELLARIGALLRRKNLATEVEVLSLADLEINIPARTVTRSGKEVRLTAREFNLLEYFMRNKGRVITRGDIADNVWDSGFDTSSNVIDVYINFLRKKIDKDFDYKLIHTVTGVGYVMRQMHGV